MKSKRIGIIGAGPAGLAALKSAFEAPGYHGGEWADPIVLEAREDVGGVWLPAPASFPIPTTTVESHPLSPKPYFASRSQPHYPPTPLYDSLTTNLPHPVMAFSSFPFPPSTPLFPKASIVHTYIAAYANQVVSTDDPRRLRDFVKTGRVVTDVRWSGKANSGSSTDKGPGFWEVEAHFENAGGAMRSERYAFDLLLICTGHYSTPNYPSEGEMPGLGAWREAGCAAHAIWYRNAESIPIPAEDHHDAFSHDRERNNTTVKRDNLNDASTSTLPSRHGVNRSGGNVEADTSIEEVYKKALADTQTSEHIPHLPARHSTQFSSAGTESSIPGSSHTQEPDGGRLGRATVLIVGAGPSGTDISADLVRAGVRRVIIASSATLSPATTPPVPSSSPSPAVSPEAYAPEVLAKPLPVRFHVRGTKPTGRVTFADGSEEDSVTFVVVATGYQVDFPFFDQRASPEQTSTSTRRFQLPKDVLPTPFWTENGGGDTGGRDARSLTNSSICVFPLARHLFPLPGFYSNQNSDRGSGAGGSHPHPTSLAFLGLNVRVAPLPLVEAQARAILSAFAYCYSPQALHTQDEDGGSKQDLDWDAEERAIRERWDNLVAQFEDSRGTKRAVQGEENDDLMKKQFIAKNWHRLPLGEQFAYRDELDVFAFELARSSQSPGTSYLKDDDAGPHKTREWEERFYMLTLVLRSAWRALEARGDGSAEEWVRGVGSGKTGRRKKVPGGGEGELMNGEEEWVDMMERLVVWWETEGKTEDRQRLLARY